MTEEERILELCAVKYEKKKEKHRFVCPSAFRLQI